MKTISAKRLEAAGACPNQVQLFRDTFGDKAVRINAKNWEKAREVGLKRGWMVRFLQGPALAEYERVRDSARAEYYRICDEDWAQRKRVRDSAVVEYEQVCGPALFAALTE